MGTRCVSCVASTACATSAIVAIPVERRSGFPSSASSRRNGKFVSSPEPTLIAGTPMSHRKRALSTSSGVLRNRIPLSAACRLTGCTSAESSSRLPSA